VLRDGRIVQDGPPRITAVDREVAAFVGSPPGDVRAGVKSCNPVADAPGCTARLSWC
jgi:hypothetical protein